jgi:hypothetical protein
LKLKKNLWEFFYHNTVCGPLQEQRSFILIVIFIIKDFFLLLKLFSILTKACLLILLMEIPTQLENTDYEFFNDLGVLLMENQISQNFAILNEVFLAPLSPTLPPLSCEPVDAQIFTKEEVAQIIESEKIKARNEVLGTIKDIVSLKKRNSEEKTQERRKDKRKIKKTKTNINGPYTTNEPLKGETHDLTAPRILPKEELYAIIRRLCNIE